MGPFTRRGMTIGFYAQIWPFKIKSKILIDIVYDIYAYFFTPKNLHKKKFSLKKSIQYYTVLYFFFLLSFFQIYTFYLFDDIMIICSTAYKKYSFFL